MLKKYAYQLRAENFFQEKLNCTTFDPLTKLPDLTFGRKIVKELIEKKTVPFALMAIKISGFAQINTNLGFDMGDRAIYHISQLLKNFLNGKGLIYRLYGNEWEVIIAPVRRQKQIIQLSEQLIQNIQQPLQINEHILYLDANIGINFFHPEKHKKLSTLLQQTHTALQKAKEAGTGHYALYSEEMSIDAFKTFQLETDIFQAIEKGELYIEYQPKVNTKSLEITGAEALLRWNHPLWGKISPNEFIPIIEKRETALEKLNQLIIDTVCDQIKAWMKQGIKKPNISINISPKSLTSSSLVTIIKNAVKRKRIPPECLTIEIIEHTFFAQLSAAKKQIESLQKLGVTLCIDDFGSGYSTLSIVKQLPIQEIKIDRTFIYNLPNSVQDQIIVSSIIDAAKKLHINVCAEGVETNEQLQILNELGCNQVQGFYFSPAIPAEQMSEWFRKQAIAPATKTNDHGIERRKYFRIKLPLPLRAQMTILTFRKRKVSLGSTEVLIIDISPGGLRFMSHLRLPVQEEIIYGFSTNLDHTTIDLSGKIVWSQELYPGIFEYGLEFSISEIERDELIQVLFRIMPKLRHNPHFIEGNFIPHDPLIYLKKTFLD